MTPEDILDLNEAVKEAQGKNIEYRMAIFAVQSELIMQNNDPLLDAFRQFVQDLQAQFDKMQEWRNQLKK